LSIKIAFQGEPGAYSELALYKYFKQEAESVPCSSFNEIFKSVDDCKAEYGILPVENSLQGTVTPAYDELVDSKLSIEHEVIIPVKHCLLGVRNNPISNIKKVISHPQALGQCSNHLKSLGIIPEPFLDTAGAAKYVQQHQCLDTAAIASKLAAEYYDLEVLKYNFEDEHYNFTRFFVLGKNTQAKLETGEYKTSIIFSAQNKPNLLSLVLNSLANYNIDLTKIESRPTRNKAWEYMFFLDFKGHQKDDKISEALISISGITDFLNVLGSYQTTTYPP